MADANPHVNHRSRLRSRFLHYGLDGFEPHNVLELLLFYSIPRRDTNPLAHALLSHFGEIERVFLTEEGELCRVKGIAERSARFLRDIRRIASLAVYYRRDRTSYLSARKIGELFVRHFRKDPEEQVYLMLLNNRHELLCCDTVFRGSIHSREFGARQIMEYALLHHASYCILAHNHPGSVALPDTADLALTRELGDILPTFGVYLLEHYFVAGEQFCTLCYRATGQGGGSEEIETSDSQKIEQESLAIFLEEAGCRPEAAPLLMARFGSLYRIFSATNEALTHCLGEKEERTVALLRLVFATVAYCAAKRPVPPPEDEEEMAEYLLDLYLGEPQEKIRVLLFDKKKKHLATEVVGVGSVNEASLSFRRTAESLLFHHAVYAVFCHNHPEGVEHPSAEDVNSTATLNLLLQNIGVTLLGHYIVADGQCAPFSWEGNPYCAQLPKDGEV